MKKILSSFTLLAVALSLSFLTGCTDDDAPVTTYSIIELNTNFGTMYLHLYDETPLHRDNFSNLVETSFLDSTEFHRVIPDFVIQGGDPLSKDEDRTNDGTGGPGYTVDAEIDSSKFKHIFGALGAARKGDATNPERKSSGSQFYIVTNPDGTHFLDGNYTVFGEVLKGMDVATTIQSQQRNGSDQPLERIKMWSKKLELTADEMDEMGLADPKQ